MTDDCRDGRLEVYLPSRSVDYPFMSACGHNASALKELPLLTSKDVEEPPAVTSSTAVLSSLLVNNNRQRRRYVHVRFVGNTYPHKAQFKIAWSELSHLPRNADSSLRTARRTANVDDDECAFQCPGDERLCLPARLVCNGAINCPGVLHDETPATCEEWNLRSAAAASASVDYGPSAVTLFVAVTTTIIVFGIALFAANAYCSRRRQRTTNTNCHATAKDRSSDRIYSTVIILKYNTIIKLQCADFACFTLLLIIYSENKAICIL